MECLKSLIVVLLIRWQENVVNVGRIITYDQKDRQDKKSEKEMDHV